MPEPPHRTMQNSPPMLVPNPDNDDVADRTNTIPPRAQHNVRTGGGGQLIFIKVGSVFISFLSRSQKNKKATGEPWPCQRNLLCQSGSFARFSMEISRTQHGMPKGHRAVAVRRRFRQQISWRDDECSSDSCYVQSKTSYKTAEYVKHFWVDNISHWFQAELSCEQDACKRQANHRKGAIFDGRLLRT